MKKKFLLCKLLLLTIFTSILYSNDLDEIKKRGELRHIGVPYANFVTGLGDGLDVELIKGFAKHLGLKYRYVPCSWIDLYDYLIGQEQKNSKDATLLNKTNPKGDLIANGMTILNWRKEILNFSNPTFPSGVWLIARADSTLTPIKPTNSIENDISLVKRKLSGRSVLALKKTGLNPKLYDINNTSNVTIKLLDNKNPDIIELIPAIIKNEAETILLDVPDALIAINKWPGEIKVIGPISENQLMGVAFRKTSPLLLNEFNKYFKKIKEDGTYNKLVLKYYPDVFQYYRDFFKQDD